MMWSSNRRNLQQQRTRNIRRWLGGAVAALPLIVYAAEPPPPPAAVAPAAPVMVATNELNKVVVSATRLASDTEQTSSPVVLVTADQIAQKQQRNLAEVLRDEVGIHVVRNGQPGGRTSVFLRGANSNQTLVLIDGVRVNNGFNNDFDFAGLSVDNIDRLEILRGPQSTLYGSEAMGGVVNIVTKRGTPQPSGAVTVEAGSHDSWQPRARFALTEGKLSVSGAGSYFTTNNQRINSDYRAWNGSARVTYDALERLSISLLGTYLQSDAGSPNDRFTNDPNDYLRRENSLLALTIEGEPTEWWELKLTLSHGHDRDYFSGLEPNPPFFFGDFTELTVVDRDQADLQSVFHVAAFHRILIGGTYDEISARDTSTFGVIDRRVRDQALYGIYEVTPLEALTFNLGGRIDDYSTFGTRATYHAGGRWTVPASGTILRANVGSGFRAPTVRDFFPPFGNPNLDAESSLGWDVGVEQPLLDDRLRVGITYFQNEFDDLIVFGFPAPTNVGRARSLGIETFAIWQPTTNLTFRGSYTWLDAEDRATNQRLLRRPEHSGNLNANYRFLERWNANLNTTLVSSCPDLNFSTFPAQRVDNAGYVLVDLGLACEVSRHLVVFGRIENLLDDRYEEVFGFPSLGRTFWAGATVGF